MAKPNSSNQITKLPLDYRVQDFKMLLKTIDNHELMKTEAAKQLDIQSLRTPEYRSKCVMRASLDDIAIGINLCKIQLGESGTAAAELGGKTQPESAKPPNPYIKIMLQKTPIIVLYEQRSVTALRDTDEGRQVEAENARYDEILAGTDKSRRTVNADTQTLSALKKSRLVNTERIASDHVASYVSNFEMFDTYQDLEKSTKSVDVGSGKQKMEITTYKVGGVDQFEGINMLPNFKLAMMLTMRILASNVFEEEQRRFRNMHMPDPLAEGVKFNYRLHLLWRHAPPKANSEYGKSTKAVTDISFCPNNGDIIAVAYGIYTYGKHTKSKVARCGHVYIWNIKNPVNPERCYDYRVPVITVEFSPFAPQLLAIGLSDGSIHVRDITNPEQPPVAITQRATSPGYEPITSIKWIPQTNGDVEIGARNIEPFLALSQNGSITKYRIINSPYLMGYEQNKLQRVDGALEGIEIERFSVLLQANRHPQGLAMALDPLQLDAFYALTDEGTMYKCSTNYPQQHLELRQIHEAAAVCMEYSPWSPKLYLTCGSDWCIRIWMVGILQPIITLRHHLLPVHCAHWSRTHSTILVSLSRSSVDIWDLRNSTLRPVSSTTIDAKIYYTTFKFSHCGRSLVVGNESGHLVMLAFEDMPFPPHFQYKQLKRAIYKALATAPEMKRLVKSLGYFGYPNFEKKINL